MRALLIFLGCLCIVAGLAMFGVTVGNIPYGADTTTYMALGVGYLLGGAASSIIPFALADIILKLEALKATP